MRNNYFILRVCSSLFLLRIFYLFSFLFHFLLFVIYPQKKNIYYSANSSPKIFASSTKQKRIRGLSIIEQTELKDAPWFQIGIPREISLEVLRRKNPGEFLVRESSTKPGCFALSLRAPPPAPQVVHYLILRTPRGYKIKVNQPFILVIFKTCIICTFFTQKTQIKTFHCQRIYHSLSRNEQKIPLTIHEFNLLTKSFVSLGFLFFKKKNLVLFSSSFALGMCKRIHIIESTHNTSFSNARTITSPIGPATTKTFVNTTTQFGRFWNVQFIKWFSKFINTNLNIFEKFLFQIYNQIKSFIVGLVTSVVVIQLFELFINIYCMYFRNVSIYLFIYLNEEYLVPSSKFISIKFHQKYLCYVLYYYNNNQWIPNTLKNNISNISKSNDIFVKLPKNRLFYVGSPVKQCILSTLL